MCDGKFPEISDRANKQPSSSRLHGMRRAACAFLILYAASLFCFGCSTARTSDTAQKEAGSASSQGSHAQTDSVTQAGSAIRQGPDSLKEAAHAWSEMTPQRSMDLLYADQFSIDFYEDDIALITIGDSDQFLLLPEGVSVPDGLPDSISVLKKPVSNIYLVATSAMDDFIRLDALDSIALSGTKESGWYLPEAKAAMEKGLINYAGKYSAPD